MTTKKPTVSPALALRAALRDHIKATYGVEPCDLQQKWLTDDTVPFAALDFSEMCDRLAAES